MNLIWPASAVVDFLGYIINTEPAPTSSQGVLFVQRPTVTANITDLLPGTTYTFKLSISLGTNANTELGEVTKTTSKS